MHNKKSNPVESRMAGMLPGIKSFHGVSSVQYFFNYKITLAGNFMRLNYSK